MHSVSKGKAKSQGPKIGNRQLQIGNDYALLLLINEITATNNAAPIIDQMIGK